MSESLRTRLQRLGFNRFPAYRRTGARITYIRHDWREVRIELPLNRRTRNYVGTLFGGSMYAAADPILMVRSRAERGDRPGSVAEAGMDAGRSRGPRTQLTKFVAAEAPCVLVGNQDVSKPKATPMRLKLLPKGHVVWVKRGEIDFLKPGRGTLHARFAIDEPEWRAVRSALEREGRVQRRYEIPLTTAAGETRATVRQTLHFRCRLGPSARGL